MHLTDRYATRSALNEEEYLAARCQSTTIAALDPARFEQALATTGGADLSEDQAAAVRGVLTSRADVNVVVGPAGTGKTSTMAVLVAAWKAEGREVLGLSISQTAANELSAATGAPAENIAKLLHETARRDRDWFPEHAERWTLRPGQLVIMDEAGMTDRAAMVAVTRLCEQAHAKLVLVGDHEQLESPEAGGAMRLMANTAETFQLGQVHRFTHDWERDASLRLRAGDVAVVDEYAARGRIYGGTAEENERRAVHLALADHVAGQRTFILAATNERAARVAGMFRAGLVHFGRVEADGVALGDGNLAGVGDRIVCRQNNRHLTTTSGGFVTNRSVYEVLARHPDASLTIAVVPPDARRPDSADTVTLPADYVATSVALEYAGTVHAAQGGTRFTSHALISERDDANSIYVAMTRGRSANIAHVDSEHDNGADQAPTVTDPAGVVARALQRKNIAENLSAVEARDLAVERSQSLATLLPIWADLASEHAKARWYETLTRSRGDQFAARVTASKAWPALATRLDSIQAAGVDAETAFQTAIDARSLTGVTDVAAVLHHRLEHDGDTAAEHSLHAPFDAHTLTDSPYAPAIRQLAARIDTRSLELGERAAQNPPAWAATLGPVPDDTVGRAEWVDRAATIASYQEAFNLDGPDPIGDPPPAGRPDARRWRNAARDALDHTRQPADWASDQELAQRIAAGDRAEMARPQPPNLAEAAQVHRAWQAERDHANETFYHLRDKPTAMSDHLTHAEQAAATARRNEHVALLHLQHAEAGYDAYRQWETTTAATRAAAETARQELARRPPPTMALADQPSSWVAHQAAQAEQHLERKQRALQSAQQAITRITARLAAQPARVDDETTQHWQPVLERQQTDAARLTLEVDAAASFAHQFNTELARRPDGDQAKTAAVRSPSRQPDRPAPVRHHSPENLSQRPPRPSI
ncbi:MAG: ATP-dependent DNA helicase [Acidimicrobiales bacterium]